MIVVRALLSHYRRHPLQAVFLLAGIVIANALLAGTLLINAQARASYDQGSQYLNAAALGHIRHRDTRLPVDEVDYIRLRRGGFDGLVPVLREFARTADGEPLELLGIDLFAMPGGRNGAEFAAPVSGQIADFKFEPWQLWAAPGRMEQLGQEDGARIVIASGHALPPLKTVAGQRLGHRLVMDLRGLQTITGRMGELSSLQLLATPDGDLEALQRALPPHLVFSHASEAPDPAELTRSFHLNLAAMGLLAFVVGIFLIYNALAFNYTDRASLVRRLRLSGVTRARMVRALLSELVLFLTAGTVAGTLLGALLAAWLLPGVGRTLAQLYGVHIAYPDGLVPAGAWLPVSMTILAAGLCAMFPLRETLDMPMLERHGAGWREHAIEQRDRSLLRLSILCLVAAGLTSVLATHLWTALAGMALLLVGAALLLPWALSTLVAGLRRVTPSRNALSHWLLSDCRWLLGPASLALMAMTLALVANSGLNTMISSFRAATDEWLNQRIVADLYARSGPRVSGLDDWLAETYPGLKVAERYSTEIGRTTPSGQSVMIGVINLRQGERFRDSIELIRQARDARARFLNGQGVYISERAWRIDGWQPGAMLRLCAARAGLPVLGVYRDYGNPRSQWMVSSGLFRQCWPAVPPSGLAVHGPPDTDWGEVRMAVSDRFALQDDDIVDQAELKRVGLAVFDRTFAVTRALNGLTLLVAGIGIFCATSAIHHHRTNQQALLTSLGVNRRQRGLILLLQWGLLGLLCMLLVWPFGALLAAYLAGVVTPVAFGWSFPLMPDWQHYLVLAVVASGALVTAVLAPSIRLLNTSPAAMLREYNV